MVVESRLESGQILGVVHEAVFDVVHGRGDGLLDNHDLLVGAASIFVLCLPVSIIHFSEDVLEAVDALIGTADIHTHLFIP